MEILEKTSLLPIYFPYREDSNNIIIIVNTSINSYNENDIKGDADIGNNSINTSLMYNIFCDSEVYTSVEGTEFKGHYS